MAADRAKASDDLAKMAQGALSVAAGLAEEARAMARAGAEALTARLDVARREDLAATESLAVSAQSATEAMEGRLATLEERLAALEARLEMLAPTHIEHKGGDGSA
jgi:BMFP domain-containing protein YqiC